MKILILIVIIIALIGVWFYHNYKKWAEFINDDNLKGEITSIVNKYLSIGVEIENLGFVARKWPFMGKVEWNSGDKTSKWMWAKSIITPIHGKILTANSYISIEFDGGIVNFDGTFNKTFNEIGDLLPRGWTLEKLCIVAHGTKEGKEYILVRSNNRNSSNKGNCYSETIHESASDIQRRLTHYHF